MVSVDYAHTFEYRYHGGRFFPILTIQLKNPDDQELAVEQDAFLDSGASRSVFNGHLPSMLGLELPDGEPWAFQTNTGEVLQARIHTVQIILAGAEGEPTPPPFTLPLAFATGNIDRNLLGRDFFDRIQIGFREHHSQFFLEPTP